MFSIGIGLVCLYLILSLALCRYLRYTLSEFLVLFFIGALTAAIVKIGLYGIGKELQIDFYFFEIKIIGKNAFSHFESVYQSFIQGLVHENRFFFFLGTIMLPAIIEEILKLMAFVVYLRFHGPLQTIYRALTGMMIIGFGFASTENILYFQSFVTSAYIPGLILLLTLLRVVLGSVSHMFFSAIIGYGFGYSIFGKYQAIEAGYTRRTGFFHKILGKFSFFDIRTRAYMDTVGSLGLSLILGIMLHIFYNLFFFLSISYVSFFSLILAIMSFIWILGDDRLLGVNFGKINEKLLFLKMQSDLSLKKEKIFDIHDSKNKLH